MSKVKEKNCRLCLEMLDVDYNIIEDYTRGIFEVLLVNVDLSITEEPLVCNSCLESMQKAYDLKSTCISVNEQIVSLTTDRNSAGLDIRDVYLNQNEHKSLVFNEDYNVCRFCLHCLEKSNFNLLNDLRKNLIDDMLLKYFPELDLNIIKEPVICSACTKSLENYSSFAKKCHNTEEIIKKYCEVQGVECNGQISLSSVLKFLLECMPEYVSNCSKTTTLTEDNLFKHEGDPYSNTNNIKLEIEEELVIKDEGKYSDYKTEESRCGETEWKAEVKYETLTPKNSSDVVMYRCETCTFETKSKGYLKMHMLIHKDVSEVTMYKCTFCNYEAKMKKYLKRHMLTHKDSSDVIMYRCELCTFQTKHQNGLSKHILIHKDNSEVTMYKCNLCSYETKWRNNLRKHMLSHKDSSDAVMHKCEKCTFETTYKYYLKKHMLSHKDKSEVVMYKCNMCSYEAKRKDYVKTHMLSHNDSSDVVMYRCETCKFETRRKDYLKMHHLIHKNSTEVTMFKCNLCNYETKQRVYLNRHMRTHKDPSEVVMFRCELCAFETKYKPSLRQHRRRIHRKNSDVTVQV